MTAIVQYKLPSFEQELREADPRLRVLVLYAAAVVVTEQWAPYVFVTSVRRPRAEGAPWSVHNVDPCRGVDLRTRGLLTDEHALALEARLRAAFDYSPLPPATEPHTCAWWETPERARERGLDPRFIVPHLHLQVPAWSGRPSAPFLALYHPSDEIV